MVHDYATSGVIYLSHYKVILATKEVTTATLQII